MIDFGRDKKPSHGGGEPPSFSDIVGQAELKRALLAVGANDGLDGLLIRGEKGTAKSTAVRALAEHLPTQRAVADCPYGCPPDSPDAPGSQCERCRERSDPPTTERPVPVVTLPLGATRERVVGTLSVADALDGDYEFDPGLLARANRGVLYVDEVNLLDDHLVDVILDAAASGVNSVERDGVSVAHPADFTLVGTMNPEEGDLRPQLRDRFALSTTVTACEDLDQRVAIIDRALGRDEGADGGTADSADRWGRQLTAARDRLADVTLPTEFAEEIAELCRDAGVDGHRGDIATARAARTFAALDDRCKVLESDVRQAASLALAHRLQSRPFEDAPDAEDLLDERFDDGEAESGDGDGQDGEDGAEGDADAGTGDCDDSGSGGEDDAGGAERDAGDESSGGGDGSDGETESGPEPSPEADDDADGDAGEDRDGPAGGGTGGSEGGERGRADGGPTEAEPTAGEPADDAPNEDDADDATPLLPGQQRADVGDAAAPDLSVPEAVDRELAAGGSRAETRPTTDSDGPRVRTQPADSTADVDALASVQATAARGGSSVESRDLRQSIRRGETAALVVFVVDTSASMRAAMRSAKGTVLELLKDAYQHRDEVAFVAFAGDDADVLLPPTDSVTRAARHLKDLPTGDRTPLPAALRTAGDVLDRADPAASVVVLVSDGRANVATGSPTVETRDAARALARHDPEVVVVDADAGDDRTGLNGLVAEETGGTRVPLAALSADRIDAAVGAARATEL